MYKPRYIQYLNLPPIPQHLIDQLDRSPQSHRQSQTSYVYGPYAWSNQGTKGINTWCQQNICAEMYFACQCMIGDFEIHKDIETKTKLTFVLDTGGNNVVTNFYDDDQTTLVGSYVIEPNRWHILKADTYHQVSNITPGQVRFSITGRIF
jgi:hypothetical protein